MKIQFLLMFKFLIRKNYEMNPHLIFFFEFYDDYFELIYKTRKIFRK
jgi:hypothetical protein